MPVPRVGAERPDVEGFAPEGMDIPSRAAARAYEGEEPTSPSVEPARFQMGEDLPRPWYYSALEDAAKSAKVEKTKPDQWLNVLRQTQGVKQEEIEVGQEGLQAITMNKAI